MKKVIKYFGNIRKSGWLFLQALDKLANAALAGDPDEYISSRMGKALKRCAMCRLICKTIHPIDPNHCIKNIQSDEGGDELWHW